MTSRPVNPYESNDQKPGADTPPGSHASEVSVVIPLYNERAVFNALMQRVQTALDTLQATWELVLVDDGSSDGTDELIRAASDADHRVRGVLLSRNFGHQAALAAGLQHARGQAVISMDGDLQDPPELIPELLARWREGFAIVHARRRKRVAKLWKRVAYRMFYRVMGWSTPLGIVPDAGDFALTDRAVLDRIHALPERTRFHRGLRAWIGFRQAVVEYDRPDRAAGESKYSLRALIRLALDGLVGFSNTPLRLVTMAGGWLFTLSAVMAVIIIGSRLWHGAAVIDATLLLMGLGAACGLNLLGMGVVGEYVARVFDEVRRRPTYVVKEETGGQPACEQHTDHGSTMRQELAPVPARPEPGEQQAQPTLV